MRCNRNFSISVLYQANNTYHHHSYSLERRNRQSELVLFIKRLTIIDLKCKKKKGKDSYYIVVDVNKLN